MEPLSPPYLRAWLWAFLFTQAVEVPIYIAALRRAARRGAGAPAAGRIAVAAAGASAITHPILWFLLIPAWLSWPAPTGWLEAALGRCCGSSPQSDARLDAAAYWLMTLVAETFAVAVEAAYLALLGPWLRAALPLRRALLLSLLANGASVALGLLSRALLQFP